MADEELPATGHQEQGGEVFRIENEEDAWKVFERAISKGVEEGKAPTIVWAGWPNIEVYLPNTPEEGSISASMMEAFLELQKSVYRTHLLLANGPSSRRRLTQIERDQFELRVKVEKGSSFYAVDLKEIAAKLGNDIVARMSGTELVISVISLALIFAGSVGYSAWLKNKTELKKISSDDDKTKTLLENYQAQLVHDTKRFEMLTKAIESRPALKQIEREVDSAKAELVKAIADDNGGKIMGIDLDKDVANEISSIPRQQSTEAKLAGQYKVAKVDTTVSDGFKVTLEDVSSGELVNASLFDAIISAQHREIIKTAEWSKKPLFVEMTGRRLRGKITDAKVVSVKDLKAQV